jgi:ubiquinone/menaquinone biosynthesis C-methylase UbiE
VTAERSVLKRAIAGIYSYAADRLYEPIVVRRAFPLLGGDLHDAVFDQGRRASRVARGRAILDMPVGTGFFAVEVARRHDSVVVGTDIARGMVVEARAAAGRHGAANLFVVQADAHALPFPDEAFGSVLCTNGLQVIPGLMTTLRELRRVLRRDGTLFATLISAPLSAALPRAASRHVPALLRSRRDVLKAFDDAGFRVVGEGRRRLALILEAVRA